MAEKLLVLAIMNAVILAINVWICLRNQRISQANEQILRELEHSRVQRDQPWAR